MRRLLTIFLALCALPAAGQDVGTCDARAQQVRTPIDEHTRAFANGNVELAVLDVAGPDHQRAQLRVEIVSSRTCRIVSFEGQAGYAAIYWSDLQSSYDPSRGLVFEVPAQIVLLEPSFTNSALIEITVNQATSDITATSRLGSE